MLQSVPTPVLLAEKCPTKLLLGPSPQLLLSLNLSSCSKLDVCLPKRVSHQIRTIVKWHLLTAWLWHNHYGDVPLGSPELPSYVLLQQALVLTPRSENLEDQLTEEQGRLPGTCRPFSSFFDMVASSSSLYFALFHSFKSIVFSILLILWVQYRADSGSEVSIV